MRDSHVVCALYYSKDNLWQIYWKIEIMEIVRFLGSHERARLAPQCTSDEKIARFKISQFYVIKIYHRVKNDYWHNWIYTKRVVSRHWTIITVSKYYRFHNKNLFSNHKCTASHYIICYILYIKFTYQTMDYQPEYSRFSNWYSLQCLVPRMNHLPPLWWSTFRLLA